MFVESEHGDRIGRGRKIYKDGVEEGIIHEAS